MLYVREALLLMGGRQLEGATLPYPGHVRLSAECITSGAPIYLDLKW